MPLAMDNALADLQARMTASAQRIEDALDAALAESPLAGERTRPARLLGAMRHGALGGGKRLRPFLVIESARLCGLAEDCVLPVAVALESIHCYSLVHDDLPAMDNDDMRRGRPTVHKSYDEATAILAGDALLTMAFDLVAGADLDAAIRIRLVSELARAAGLGGMAGGQMLDIEGEAGRPDATAIIAMQAMKTGALIRFAARAGGIAAAVPDAHLDALTRYGEVIGLAFQIADDLLDVTATSAELGKTAGKDIAQNKATLVSLNGADWARRELSRLRDEARDTLAIFGKHAAVLAALADFVIGRKS